MDELKATILLLKLSLELPEISVKVSDPLDVRINPELKLCKPGSFKNFILLLWRKLKNSLSNSAVVWVAKATDNAALPIPLFLIVFIFVRSVEFRELKSEDVPTNTTSLMLLELTTVSKFVRNRPSTDTTNFVLIYSVLVDLGIIITTF